jgi:hypothetical protein
MPAAGGTQLSSLNRPRRMHATAGSEPICAVNGMGCGRDGGQPGGGKAVPGDEPGADCAEFLDGLRAWVGDLPEHSARQPVEKAVAAPV